MTKKITKTVKYQIIKPISCDWATLGKVLKDLQDETHRVLNRCIQLCWEWQGYSSAYKESVGVYPNTADVLGKSLQGYINERVRIEYPKFHSGNLSQTVQRAIKKWEQSAKDVYLGNVSIPSYRKDCSIDLRKDSIQISKVGPDYVFSLGLVSRAYKASAGLPSCRFEVVVNHSGSSGRAILDRIISGEYTCCGSQITRDRRTKKWFINLSYQFEPKKVQLDPSLILGIDRGYTAFHAYLAVNKGHYREGIPAGEIEEFNRRIAARRKKLLEQGKYCGDGRIGHGIRTRIKPIDKLAERVKNFRNTVNDKYSRYIVEKARKLGCGVIQMEDLKGIRDEKPYLSNWPYYDFQMKIENKAREYGIEVRYVNPRYTSQRCHKCGYIDSRNRPDQATFHCLACGLTTNADYNAAKNIATENIDKIISES